MPVGYLLSQGENCLNERVVLLTASATLGEIISVRTVLMSQRSHPLSPTFEQGGRIAYKALRAKTRLVFHIFLRVLANLCT